MKKIFCHAVREMHTYIPDLFSFRKSTRRITNVNALLSQSTQRIIQTQNPKTALPVDAG